MSTHSSITLKLKNGNYKSVYCHHDGYLEDVGKTLYNHYQSYNKTHNLLNMGDMANLGVDLDTSYFYKRDDGELNSEAKIVNTFDDVYKHEYNYLLDDGHWYVQSVKMKGNKLLPLNSFTEVFREELQDKPKKKSSLKEYKCVNSMGIEDQFTEGENYVLSQGNSDREMLSLYDNVGIVRECFAERFETVGDEMLQKMMMTPDPKVSASDDFMNMILTKMNG